MESTNEEALHAGARTHARAGSIGRRGLLGVWPERQEKVRIADAVIEYMTGWDVSRVRLGYLPHRVLVEIKAYSSGFEECILVGQDFGDRMMRGIST
jgi:hypothetical protein